MGDESDVATYKVVQMGADNGPTATSRLVILQTRKQQLEERISAKNKELRRLCIQEAELTGIMPPEIPLEPGETLPTFRKRIGTAFEYPQNIVNSLSNEDETVPALETKIEVQKKIAEAALQLANNATISKSIRRKNMSLYRQTKQQLDFMEERLKTVKIQVKSLGTSSNSQNQQLKQKKKPRPFLEADTISTKSSNFSHGEEISVNRPIAQPVLQRDQNRTAERYILTNKYNTFSNTTSYLSECDLHNSEAQNYHVSDDNLIPPVSKLSLNNYDRNSNEDGSPHIQAPYSHSSPNIYHQHQSHSQYLSNSQTLPHISPNQYQRASAHGSLHFPSHSHTLHYPNTRLRCHPEERKHGNDVYRVSYNQDTYPYYNTSNSHPILMHLSPQNYKQLGFIEPNHHILSHQQYEPELVPSAGLGGHWVKTENGEMIWCPTLHDDVTTAWHTDKRFGSLDRRKAKHIRNKRTSPNLDMVNKQPVPVRPVLNAQDIPRPMTLQPVPSTTRSERHDRQLVRTQSLGSVGAQTVDSVWPSDDNSSYDSDGHSINELSIASRKLKQKGWCETSLDVPAAVQNTVTEEVRTPPQRPVSSPVVLSPSLSLRTPRTILEIPAESNPSPMHMETFNNAVLTDLPKNCTVVHAGQVIPYREETKPFEMSDFYKYSTKFRERNQDKPINKNENGNISQESSFGASPRTPNDNCSQEDIYQKGVYQPLQPMKCQPLNSSNSSFNRYLGSPCADNINSSVDSMGLNSSNVAVAEHFSAEMNAWYQTHSHGDPRIDNNNTSTSPVPLGRSTATLV